MESGLSGGEIENGGSAGAGFGVLVFVGVGFWRGALKRVDVEDLGLKEGSGEIWEMVLQNRWEGNLVVSGQFRS